MIKARKRLTPFHLKVLDILLKEAVGNHSVEEIARVADPPIGCEAAEMITVMHDLVEAGYCFESARNYYLATGVRPWEYRSIDDEWES